MLSRAWMEVDLGALVRNADALAKRAGVPLIPMVKADAYGLGAKPVAHALEQLSPLAYGVATVDEGVELREAESDNRWGSGRSQRGHLRRARTLPERACRAVPHRSLQSSFPV